MAGLAAIVRQMAHRLHTIATLAEEGSTGARVSRSPGAANRDGPLADSFSGQHQRQGASGRNRRTEKNGPQAIGRSRGGCTTKIHLVAANERTALMLKLSPGQAGDAPQGRELLAA